MGSPAILDLTAHQNAAPRAPATDTAQRFERAMLDASGLEWANPRTAAADAAKRFEEQILSRGAEGAWVFGPVEQIASSYGLSPFVARQALRILEARGLGKMRRGTGGGLIICSPSLTQMSRVLAFYLCAFGINSRDVAASRITLAPHLNHCRPLARKFMDDLFDSLSLQFILRENGNINEGHSSNRAEGIAWRIIARARDGKTEDLGSAEHLCCVFSCGRPIMTQAIRILEDMGIATIVRGRGGGVRLTPPSLCAATYAIAGYLRAWNFCSQTASELVWAMNKAHAVYATGRRDNNLAHIKLAGERLSCESFIEGNWSEQIRLFRVVAEHADNMVIHLILKSLFVYEVIRFGFLRNETDNITAKFAFASTRDVGAAVLRGDAAAAVDALDICRMITFKTRRWN